ncbi:MFS transporter [Halomonas mongoliensis]|uniref:MFS transporter n=1 Tax=Halomonas mongoliensis TaxID=321265 RepID=UPI00403AE5FB
MSLFRAPPSVIIVLAGIASALHMGKVPPALHVLGGDFSLSLFQSGLLLSLIQLAGMCGSIFIGLYADITGLKRNIMAGLFVLSSAGVCQHSWHIKWFWLFKALLPVAPDPARDSGALSLAG